jgi:hypothetical protein
MATQGGAGPGLDGIVEAVMVVSGNVRPGKRGKAGCVKAGLGSPGKAGIGKARCGLDGQLRRDKDGRVLQRM